MPRQRIISENVIYGIILFFLSALPYLILIGFKKDLILGAPHLDTATIEVPIRTFEFRFLSKGILPLWNPYLYCGIPTTSSWADIFYPLSLIHLFLPLPLAINLLVILHQALGGIFMYLYLKNITQDTSSSFLGAMVFILSSTFITRIFAGHLTIIFLITWMPLLFLFIDKALSAKNHIFTILAGFTLSLQIISGHIQFVFIVLVALFLYVAYANSYSYLDKKSIKDILHPFYIFSLVILFGIGISAIKILSLVEQAKEATRINNPAWNYTFSMPPENLLAILCPGFFGWIHHNIYWGKWFPWEVCLYVGILPLLLSFLAILKKTMHSRFFAWLFLLSLILSLGAYLPFRTYIFKYILGFNLFRASGRFLILGAFSLSVLTTLGSCNLKNYKESLKQRKILLAIVSAATVLFILVILRFIVAYHPLLWFKICSFFISYDNLIRGSRYLTNFLYGNRVVVFSLNNSILFLFLGICLIVAYIRHWLKKNMFTFLMAIVIIADLLSFSSNYYSVFSLKDCYLDRQAAAFLENNIGQYRYLPFGVGNFNAGLMDRIPSIGGYYPLIPKRISEFMNFTQGRPLDSPVVNDNIRQVLPLFQLLNLKYILVNRDIKPPSSYFAQVYCNKNVSIFQTPSLPKAFIVHKAKVITERNAIFEALSDASFNFKDTVILEEPFNLALREDAASIAEPEPVITDYSPNRVVVKAEVKANGYLVLCDNYYPGWKAYVNGKKTQILKADYILRAVPLYAGNHTIEFIYSPASFKVGLFITLLFLIVAIVILVRSLAIRYANIR